MKLNRKWLMVIALVMSLTMATAGTLAYLTDRDSEANVFTIGNVEIDLKEDFENGAELIPGVNIEKKPTITNIGRNDAWVWAEIAIPSALNDTSSASKNAVHFNMSKESVEKGLWNWWDGADYSEGAYMITTKDINGVSYDVYTVQYETALKPGETTAQPVMYKVYLDPHVDIDPDGNWALVEDGVVTPINWNSNTNGNPVIYVSAYAMQTAGFDSVYVAYDAYKSQWGDNGGEYAEPQMPGEPAPANAKAEYNGKTYDDIYKAVAAANQNGGGTITLLGSAKLDKPVEIASNITIKGEKNAITYTREDSFTGTMFTVKAGTTLTVENVVLDGAGATATGNLIATEGNGSIVLNAGAVLQNNNGAHAVSLATRGGGTLTLNGAQIIKNSSGSGAIWGGGHIIVNEGSKINNNSSTGIAGAIRMVGSCNLTMNGGEISNNTAAGDGGAIWGYGSSTYNFNGGKMSGNTSAGTGGAIYTGTYSVINIGGDFEMKDNKAANSGAIRLTDHTSMNMTGGVISGNTQNGESNAFNTWNNSISITGGTINDDFSYVGGLGLTIGKADINGVVSYDLATNHNTAYLAKDFEGFKFKVNTESSNFASFNFKPASDYTYTAGDENKLVCMNDGYVTYWDAATNTFRLKAN